MMMMTVMMMMVLMMGLVLGVFAPGSQSTAVNLMVLLPYTGPWPVGRSIAGAVHEAVDYVNQHPTVLPGRTLRFAWNDTHCSARKGLGEMVAMYFQMGRDLHAVIGGGCNAVCETTGLLAAEWNVPMVSWGCRAPQLSDKDTYPTLARTVAPYGKMSPVLVGAFKHWGWTQLAIMASSEHAWQTGAETFKIDLEEQGIRVTDFHTFEPGHESMSSRDLNMHRDVLIELVHKARVFIICANGGDIRDIMLNALDLGLINGKYAFITMDLTVDALHGANTWMGEDGRDEEAVAAFTGLLNIYPHTPNTPEYRAFEARVRMQDGREPFDNPLHARAPVDVHAAMLYDAILLYANALHDALEDGHNEYDGISVSRKMFNNTFQGLIGDIYIDEYGNRLPDYTIQNYQKRQFVEVADYLNGVQRFEMRSGVTMVFPGGVTSPPRDHPECGWNNELCPDTTLTTVVAVSLCILVVLVVLLLVGWLLYRRMRYEAELNSEDLWRIRQDDLKHSHSTKSSRVIIGRKSDSDGSSSDTTTMTSSKDNSSDHGQIFTSVAFYKGRRVAVKAIAQNQVVVSRALLLDMKQVRELQHENVNAFVGLCIDPLHPSVATLYCSRGSLQDILENDDVKVNNDFIISFLMDICKGMEYVSNSSLGSHGRLKSSNCVVDNRWVCKVTDLGLQSLRDEHAVDPTEGEEIYKHFASLLWTAPELLRQRRPPPYGSKEGDVYSYGIILHEVVQRSGPYSAVPKEPKDIIQLVQTGLSPPFRPIVNPESCPGYLRLLMTRCWAEDPKERPTFTKIKKVLRQENKGKKLDILDNLLKMMEQYADHLEELVSDRTKQLEEEQKKTDQLLFQMLPQSVAESLKFGQDICPEAFAGVTVYFSDVVGFTKLASNSTPFEVVNFLNDLYTTFDAVIDNYDVYKVETIGDAYMVASGLPKRNGDRHAGEIASMSLDILHSVGKFRISHLPKQHMHLRIGIHTGPVVAGVVGRKMPRYCLFGDTVNTASRMESSGLDLRIHISSSTRDVLTILGGYHMEPRGQIEVKGKGKLETLWLTGKNGFHKTLPDLSNAAPLEEHIFK